MRNLRYWLVAAAFSLSSVAILISSPSGSLAAEARDLSIHGEINIKLREEGGSLRVFAGDLDGAVLQQTESGVQFFTRDNQLLGKCVKSSPEKSEIQDRNGAVVLTRTSLDTGYKILAADGSTLNRVKIKEDKFNIYDPQDNRLRHGKQKPDGFGVKTEKDEQILKIKGAKTLLEASYLSLPIQEEKRILLWACQ